VLDRFGDVAVEGTGDAVTALDGNPIPAGEVEALLARFSRRLGLVTVAPNVWIVDHGRLLEVTASDATELVGSERGTTAVVVTRA